MMCGTARLVAGSLQNLCCHRLVLFLAFAKEHFAATLVEDQRRGLHGDCSISRGLRPVCLLYTDIEFTSMGTPKCHFMLASTEHSC